MNESEENKELIQRIAETLRNHAEPYKEGAWERFSAAQGIIPRKRVLWPYWSAAAVLLVAAALFLAVPGSDVPTSTIASLETEHPVIPEPAEPIEPVVPAASAQATATKFSDGTGGASKRRSQQNQQHPADDETSVEPKATAVAQKTTPAADISTDEPPTSPPEQRVAAVDQQEVPEMPVGPTDRFSKKQEYAVIAEGTRGDTGRKWDLGVAVSPSMTSEKLNLSGGIAVAYQVSDKFSVGSGVSIGRLGMGENPNYDPSSGEPPQYHSPADGIQGLADSREAYKRDVTLTSNVVALDIPLDFRYEVFKGFYTSVGVSYVAVLSEQRTEHFIGGLNENTFGSDKPSGKDLVASTTVGYMSEKMDIQPLKGKGYAGFMNFSVGRRVSLSKHLFFSIEPYFKLPIGQLSKEQMDFTNGGIRIVTGF